MKVVKGLRKLLHPLEFMDWIHCGLDSCGLAKGVLFNRSNNYVQIYLLKKVLLGSSFDQVPLLSCIFVQMFLVELCYCSV